MPSTFSRSARRVVPIKTAILAGAGAPRRRMVHPKAASHLRRRADDVEQVQKVMPIVQAVPARGLQRDERLMRDWPAENENPRANATAVSMWDSKPCLLAAFWGWLPSAPRK